MNPVHGVDGGVLSFELLPSRGTIDYHIILSTSKDEGSTSICDVLQKNALGTNDAMKVLNEFISMTLDLEIHGTNFRQCPSFYFNAKNQ